MGKKNSTVTFIQKNIFVREKGGKMNQQVQYHKKLIQLRKLIGPCKVTPHETEKCFNICIKQIHYIVNIDPGFLNTMSWAKVTTYGRSVLTTSALQTAYELYKPYIYQNDVKK